MRNQQRPRGGMAGPGWSRDTRRVLVLWAILSLIMIILVLVIPRNLAGLMGTASGQKDDWNRTMEFFAILAAPVWSFVIVYVTYSVYRWRSPGRPTRDGPPLRAGRNIQIAWVAITALLVTFLYAWGLIFLDRVDAAPPPGSNVLLVDVTGEQWNWDFTYPQYGNAQSEILELPVGRPVLFQITSVDVVHEFGIPAMTIHMQANPGQFTYIRVFPTQLGAFSLRCYELCGLFHAYMEAPVYVVTPSAFATWAAAQPKGYPWPIAGAGVPYHFGEPGAPAPTSTFPCNLTPYSASQCNGSSGTSGPANGSSSGGGAAGGGKGGGSGTPTPGTPTPGGNGP